MAYKQHNLFMLFVRHKSWYSVVSLCRCSLFHSRVGLRTYQQPCIKTISLLCTLLVLSYFTYIYIYIYIYIYTSIPPSGSSRHVIGWPLPVLLWRYIFSVCSNIRGEDAARRSTLPSQIARHHISAEESSTSHHRENIKGRSMACLCRH